VVRTRGRSGEGARLRAEARGSARSARPQRDSRRLTFRTIIVPPAQYAISSSIM
jgi:hypothetical protein